MPITLLSGPANAGKAELVFDTVRAHLARGEEPLLVLPTRADSEHYLRELAREHAVMGLRVERFAGLIEEIVRRARVADAELSELAQSRLLALLATRTGIASPRTHPAAGGLARALRGFVGELEARRVSPERLRSALSLWAQAGGERATALALSDLYEGYREALSRMRRLDPQQRALRALDALRRTPSMWRSTPVVLYGFDSLSALQLDVVETLGRVLDASVTVSLAYEPGRAAFAGRAATFAALEPLATEHRRLAARADYYDASSRPALSHLERSLFELDADRVDAGDALGLLEGGGERAELELVAEEIRALLDAGLPAGEIAVATRSPELVADLLEEVFTEAQIPFALQRRRRLGASALGRALIGLLRCVPGARGGDAEGELGDLLAWLRSPGLLERPELADALELAARRSGASSARAARALWEERNWTLARLDALIDSQQHGPRALLDRATFELSLLFSAPRRARRGAEQRACR